MAVQTVTKPPALDETLQSTNAALGTLNSTNGTLAKDASFKTTENTPRNLADVLAQELSRIADVVKPDAEDVDYDNTSSGLEAENVQDAIDELAENKVEKEDGKGLSTNDYTTAEKTKLAGISTNANKTEASTTNGNIKIDNVETPVYRNYGNNTVLQTDKTPFLTRQTLNPIGFSGYVREKLIGASYAWNQLVQNGNFASTSGWTSQRGTISASNNVLSYTLTEVGVADVQNRIERYIDVIQGHKYLLSASFKPAHTTKVGFRNAQSSFTLGEATVPSTTFTRVSAIFNATATANLNMYWVWICGDAGYSVGDVNYIKECQVIDLTLAFGSSVADTLYAMTNNGGIDWLRNHNYPIDQYTQYGYYLVSTKPSAKRIAGYGKNLFNKDSVELGAINQTTGADEDSTTIYRTKGYIYVKPSVKYRISGTSTYTIRIFIYSDSALLVTNTYSSGEFTITMPSNATRVRFQASTFNSFKDTMQMEVGSTTTAYEEYKTLDYSLGSTELRGHLIVSNGEIVAEGDVRESNGDVTRVRGRVDLGTLTYTYDSTNQRFSASASSLGMKQATARKLFLLTPKYECKFHEEEFDNTWDKVIYNASTLFYIHDHSYTDAATFKTAMSGIYMEFDLATPTTETSSPFADPMSLNGCTTEEYVDDRTIPVPVGHETQYMGQSEDVVEIPSMPQSDGVWVQKCYVSGGKAQYVWELET